MADNFSQSTDADSNSDFEALSSSDEALGKLAHDARNCIFALRNGIGLLQSQGQSSNSVPPLDSSEILTWMERDISRAAQLVEELIAAAKKRPPAP